MTWVCLGHDRFRVPPCQSLTRGKHSRRDQIQSGARNKPGQNPSGARFAHRVGRDNYVGKFFGGHAIRLFLSGLQINRAGAGNRNRSRVRERIFCPFPASTLFPGRARFPSIRRVVVAPSSLDKVNTSMPMTGGYFCNELRSTSHGGELPPRQDRVAVENGLLLFAGSGGFRKGSNCRRERDAGSKSEERRSRSR